MPPPLPPQPQSNNKPPLLVSADDECYPFIRSLANYAASKVSSLSKSDISLLSDDALTRLIESQLERLSEDELNRLYDATGSPFLPITEAIFDSIFPPVITQPKKKEKEYSEENLSDIASYIVTSYIKCFAVLTVIVSTVTLFQIFFKRLGKRISSSKRRRDAIVTITPQQEKLQPSKRLIYLSTKYSRTPDLKGLKGIGETYIQETDMGFRQVMIQESFVNGESFSLPAITPFKLSSSNKLFLLLSYFFLFESLLFIYLYFIFLPSSYIISTIAIYLRV